MVAAFVGALLAKTVTCTLPVVLCCCSGWRHGRLTRRDVVATLPLFAVGCVLALVTIWMERSHVGARGAPWDLSPLARVLIAGRALWFYLATVLVAPSAELRVSALDDRPVDVVAMALPARRGRRRPRPVARPRPLRPLADRRAAPASP